MSTLNSSSRFDDRVEDYVRYRPGYPPQLLVFLDQCGVALGTPVADIGSGTGITAKLFLDAGHPVFAVDPNRAMRAAADQALGDYPGYRSVEGTAEETGLRAASVGLVTAGQAFHWFDPSRAMREFARILTSDGLIAIFWNSRRVGGTPFLEQYEALLQRFAPDYQHVSEKYSDDATMRAWFGAGFLGMQTFENVQRLDYPALLGRLMSSSYAPKPPHPAHQPMLERLREIFAATEEQGQVALTYDTRVFVGRPSAV